MKRLEGKTCLVTGAGGGIGAAAARAFVSEGAFVWLLGATAQKLDALATELGDNAVPLVADVRDERSVEAAFDIVRQRSGRLDVLYTCAAVQLVGEDTRVHELDLEVWQRTVDTNLTGVFLCCKHGIRLMLESGDGGSVINCGSPTGLTMCGAGFTAYSSSKGGVMSMTRILAADYARDNIRVNGIIPGTIVTPLTKRLIEDPETHQQLLAGTPLGRLGEPDDLAGITVYLASDESRFTTGAHFAVDGGLTVR